MVGIALDKLVWNLKDGSDPEILFIRNTSPQISISVNFIFFYSHHTITVGHLQNTVLLSFSLMKQLQKIKKQMNQQGPTVQHRKLCSGLWCSMDGRGIWGRMDTSICMAESLWKYKTWLISYTPLQNKKFFKKKSAFLCDQSICCAPIVIKPSLLQGGRWANHGEALAWKCGVAPTRARQNAEFGGGRH